MENLLVIVLCMLISIVFIFVAGFLAYYFYKKVEELDK
jgi:hypothetical protein